MKIEDMMKIEEFEIHVGKAEFPYVPVRRLEAKCESATALSASPTVEELNGRMRAMAASFGANAIVEVECKNGMSMASWKSLKGTGLAVTKLSDQAKCFVCAETIKRDALLCRYCGADLTKSESKLEPVSDAIKTHSDVEMPIDPLRSLNNSLVWLILVSVTFFVGLILVVSAGSRH